MAEPDSWEDVEEGGGGASRRSPQTTTSVAAAAGAAKLNADAPAFTFNPSAASFTPFVPAPAAVVYHPVAAGPPPKPHFHDVNASADLHSAHQTPFMSGASALPALAGRNTEPPQETDVASELVVDSSQAPETRDLDVDLKEDAAEEQIPPPAAEEKDVAAPSNGSVEIQVADAASDMAGLSIKDPEPVPEEENEEVAHEGESKSAEALEADKDDSRQHLNVVFIGHVDAGKSTIGGQILYLSNMVDERTIQKYEREAKEKNRESWYMAYIMDTNEEERAKGKTVEVGRAHFETKKTRFTILDAPGHKNYVPNMISGASQADVGVLVSAIPDLETLQTVIH